MSSNNAPNVGKILKTKHEEAVKNLKEVQQQTQKTLLARQNLESQLHENELVKEEMDKLTESDVVYKLVGPVLVKQETVEAKSNVDKRLKYIGDELGRQETLLKSLESKHQERREEVQQIQRQIEQICQ